jgi:hypothetical protein
VEDVSRVTFELDDLLLGLKGRETNWAVATILKEKVTKGDLTKTLKKGVGTSKRVVYCDFL